MSEHQFYTIRARGDKTAEVLIYGDIGESWYGESVTAKQFVKDLNALDDIDTLTIRINSPGGSVSDGIAIHNAIRRHSASTHVVIDSLAASAASLIAMAGDTVEMAENALLMVHAPWGVSIGNSNEMREFADLLDTWATAMASSYARKTGKPQDEMLGLLTDGQDHWYTASEAQGVGFVDEITEALPMAASIDRAAVAKKFKTLPKPGSFQAAAAAQPAHKETTMPEQTATAAEPQAAIDTQAVEAAALAKDKQRRESIKALKTGSLVNMSGIDDVIDAAADDINCSVETARERVLAHIAKDTTPLGAGHIHVVEDEHDKHVRAAGDMLLFRAGLRKVRNQSGQDIVINMQGNPYRGATLLDLAKASLQRSGRSIAGMGKMEIVGQAFQTTSDFPTLLENTMHKVLLNAYATAPDTWSRFCRVGDLADFRPHNRVRAGSIGNLDTLNEHGEFRTKQIPDAEKGTIQASTRGNLIGITREVIVNDDLQALTDLGQVLGRVYKRTIEAAVYALLAENSGLGPTMLDGLTLFHSSHGNIGTGAAISMAALDADRVLMAGQTDVGGNDYLDLRPAKLVLPTSLGGTARSINDALYDPDTTGKLQKPNMVNGLFDDIIDTPRVSGTRRYLFADPMEAPVIEVGFLDGMQEPFIETRDGWSVDGAELKVRGDFGVAAIDYRGAVTNAGQ